MNHDAVESTEKKARKAHWVVKCFAVVAVVWILGGVYSVYSAANQAVQAEKTLHAMDGALSLLTEYQRSEAGWPSSWDDLRQTKIGESLFNRAWPQSEKEMRRRVQIDFDKLPYNAVDAVTPIGPCYDYTHRPGYLYLKSLSEQLSDPKPLPNGLRAEADPQ